MTDRVIPVRLPMNTFDLMESIRKQRNARMRGEPLTRSAWIREAIREKIAHATRSRKKKGPAPFRCCKCGLTLPAEFVGYTENLLTGKKEYTCIGCADTKKAQSNPPQLDQGPNNVSEDHQP